MFGLIRTAILIMLAFVGGMLVERSQVADVCTAMGGEMQDGVCWNE